MGEEGEDAPKTTARECIAQLRMLTEAGQPGSRLLQEAQDANLAMMQAAAGAELGDDIAPLQLASWDGVLACVARTCEEACVAAGRNKLLIADALKALTQWLERADVCASLFGCVPQVISCRTYSQHACMFPCIRLYTCTFYLTPFSLAAHCVRARACALFLSG